MVGEACARRVPRRAAEAAARSRRKREATSLLRIVCSVKYQRAHYHVPGTSTHKDQARSNARCVAGIMCSRTVGCSEQNSNENNDNNGNQGEERPLQSLQQIELVVYSHSNTANQRTKKRTLAILEVPVASI